MRKESWLSLWLHWTVIVLIHSMMKLSGWYNSYAIVVVVVCVYLLFRAQGVILNSMKLGENIARNAALRENVFMMVICIELRIPLFLVGKPGSSKSLAKSIVADSMSGITSETQLLKEFKEVKFKFN